MLLQRVIHKQQQFCSCVRTCLSDCTGYLIHTSVSVWLARPWIPPPCWLV